jgi:divalent metal cation (Fe/Co/Zn/Cd) transporter
VAAGSPARADALLAEPGVDGAEGAIALTAGILAGSIALIAFGIDSAIEGFASGR